MRRRTRQYLQTLRRADAFLSSRDYNITLGTLAPHIAELRRVVQRLRLRVIEQEVRRRNLRAATQRKRAAKALLWNEMLRPISIMSKRQIDGEADLSRTFVLPKGRSDETVLQLGSGFVENLRRHEQLFLNRGLAPDFVALVEEAVGKMRAAIVEYGLERAARVGATRGVLLEAVNGRYQLRLINQMLEPRLANLAGELAEWRSIIRYIRESEVRGDKRAQPVLVAGGGEGASATAGGAEREAVGSIGPGTEEVKAA